MEGQFTEPSGVAVNAQNDIIVADTNNHQIKIFYKEGRLKFQFGECGNHDGQLLYPTRFAVVKASGDIIVTERSPTHQGCNTFSVYIYISQAIVTGVYTLREYIHSRWAVAILIVSENQRLLLACLSCLTQ